MLFFKEGFLEKECSYLRKKLDKRDLRRYNRYRELRTEISHSNMTREYIVFAFLSGFV